MISVYKIFRVLINLQRPIGNRKGHSKMETGLCCSSPGLLLCSEARRTVFCGPVENEGKSTRYRTDQFYLREFLSHEENIALTLSLQNYLGVAFAFYSAFFCTIPYRDTFAKSDMCHPSEHLLFPVKRSLTDDKSFCF